MSAPQVSAPAPLPRVYSCFRCNAPTAYFPGRLCQECATEKTKEVKPDAQNPGEAA